MKIDVVYTWVNGSDPEWQEKKHRRLEEIGIPIANTAIETCRFVEHDELKYSLRSVYTFAPWVNKVYIITDKQIPSWFNTDNSWCVIIDHKEIFTDLGQLPTFNSNAIESQIHRIPGLEEYFLYFNDDFFLGRPCTFTDFVSKDGRPFVFVSRLNTFISKKERIKKDEVNREKNEYQAGLVNSRNLIFSEYGKLCKFTIAHGIRVYRKSIMNYLEGVFSKQFLETTGNTFRTFNDILSFAILGYYLSITRKGKIRKLRKIRKRRYFLSNFISKLSAYLYFYIGIQSNDFVKKISLLTKYGAFQFCINDEPNSTPERYKHISDFLESKFPEKSPAEL